MSKTLNQLEEQIKALAKKCAITKVYLPKAGRTFLCVYVAGISSSIRLYDEEHELKEVANIRYTPSYHSCYIKSFETLAELQQQGLGRFIYNLALAHSDKLGTTSCYGFIAPTNTIVGSDNFKDDYKALTEIYKHLGNKVNGKGISSELMFESSWKQGERFNQLDPSMQAFIDQIIALDSTVTSNV